MAEAQAALDERKRDLDGKKSELEDITRDTQKEEEQLDERSKMLQTKIEERLLTAYKRIRTNARNGLAVVSVQRDACGGCFNQIPRRGSLTSDRGKKSSSANIADVSSSTTKSSTKKHKRIKIFMCVETGLRPVST